MMCSPTRQWLIFAFIFFSRQAYYESVVSLSVTSIWGLGLDGLSICYLFLFLLGSPIHMDIGKTAMVVRLGTGRVTCLIISSGIWIGGGLDE